MIVYADREQVVETHAFSRRVQAATDPAERLILEGQLESGIADALLQDRDDVLPEQAPVPDRITIRPPEGFAYYALYPELYRDAALRFRRDHPDGACVVIGIRSIGTSLSKVVANAAGADWRFTVRPRGHPYSRELRLSQRLEDGIRIRRGDWFLVVDEGPGLSGSSFISVAVKLEELGIVRERIVFFPSHDPDPNRFVSERSRKLWRTYACYVELFREHRFLPPAARELSGGQWRDLLYSGEAQYPAVQPQHERRKYLIGDRLWKFSGLAHLGRSRLERAQRLEAFCPPAFGVENGFLIQTWLPGRPAILSEALLDRMAEYLAFLRAEFQTDVPVPVSALEQMVEVNTGVRVRAPEQGVVVALDGRMLPQEWLEAPSGYVKTDALDHHDDHFFPGCQDIAWDLAGASVEWGFPADALVDRYVRLQGDCGVRRRMPFYLQAYRAFRFGYCSMAADTLGDTPDGRRFRAMGETYM